MELFDYSTVLGSVIHPGGLVTDEISLDFRQLMSVEGNVKNPSTLLDE